MTKRRRILHADKIIQNAVNIFCLLMFLQTKCYHTINSSPTLLFSTTSDLRIANISKPNKVNIFLKGLQQGSAVDFLYHKDLICCSDQTAELIQCVKYNETYIGEKEKIVSTELVTPTGIAIDWYTDKIYWTDGEMNRVEVISLEQRHRKVLYWSEIDLARAIAVVPEQGLMFWTDWGDVPKIERAGMDGDLSTRRVIIKDDIYWPNGISIDYATNTIYWLDAKLKFVEAVDFNGENRRKVVKKGLEYPYALTFFNDKLYWTDWKTWSIHGWDLSDNHSRGIREVLKSTPIVPVDVKVLTASRQPAPIETHPCTQNNGGCSHLCLLSPNPPGYKCACETGVKLKEGSATNCHDTPQVMLLVAQRGDIARVSLDSPDYTPAVLSLKELKRTLSVDVDPVSEHIYWCDSMTHSISRARLDGSEQTTVVHNAGYPDSLCVDPVARLVYWSDPHADTISVATLTEHTTKVLIYEDLSEPRAIALHLGTNGGWMFWTDWSERRPKIERANLDGSQRTLLVGDRLAWPNGLAVDIVNNRIYWGDARTHKIESCDVNGANRRELVTSDVLHIFGLTLLNDRLYWTDMQRRTLDSVDIRTGTDRITIVEQMANMMGIKAYRVGDMPPTNECARNNGGCSHFCFHATPKYHCGCPIGLELSDDDRTCVEPNAFLVYARRNQIVRLSLHRPNYDDVLPLKDVKEISALAVHEAGGKIYWADAKTRTIQRCNADGSDPERVLDTIGQVEGLAIDWSAQNMYWSEASLGRIEVARLDGSGRRALLWQGLKKPAHIALDVRRGYMYWSEVGSRCIKRAGMDGSNPSVVVEGAGRVHALALDSEARALYWASLDPPKVEVAQLNGTGRRVLLDNLTMPYALAVHLDSLYWGDWNTGIIGGALKKDGTGWRTLITGADYVSQVAVWVKSRGEAADGNQCGVDNGGCPVLCVPHPNHAAATEPYRCLCAAHYVQRNNTCQPPEEFLLFAQKNVIGHVLVNSGECGDVILPLSGLHSLRVIDYDPIEKQVYWIDDDTTSIRRASFTHAPTTYSDSTVVISATTRVLSFALDSIGRVLYWTCADNDAINATTLDGKVSGVILRVPRTQPTHVAFHIHKRVLIWYEAVSGMIWKADPDGSGRAKVAPAHNVTTLTVDQRAHTVYWLTHSQLHVTAPIVPDHDREADGDRGVVWQGSAAAVAGAGPTGGVWVGGERLLRLRGGANASPSPHPYPHLLRITALHQVVKIDESHPCMRGGSCVSGEAGGGGGGWGTCGADGRCGCGLGCAHGPHHTTNQHCASGELPCANSDRCIPNLWRCDGMSDCTDGSDEDNCGLCAGGVRCVDGTCVTHPNLCSAAAMCPPHPLYQNVFRCDDRLCLGIHLVCDGEPHCADGSDEAPQACPQAREVDRPPEYIDGSNEAEESRGGGAGWGVVCGAVVGSGAAALAVWAALRRCRRERDKRRPPPPLTVLRLEPQGASTTFGSDSSSGRYPRPTANPPPSPATVSVAWGERRRPYRHYRLMNRVPPPTPASTDADPDPDEFRARAPPPTPTPM